MEDGFGVALPFRGDGRGGLGEALLEDESAVALPLSRPLDLPFGLPLGGSDATEEESGSGLEAGTKNSEASSWFKFDSTAGMGN